MRHTASQAVAVVAEQDPKAGARDEAAHLARLLAAQRELLHNALTPEALATLAVAWAQRLTGAAGAALLRPGPDGLVCESVGGALRAPLGRGLPRVDGLVGRCLQVGQAQTCPDARAEVGTDAEACASAGLLGMVVAPLLEGPVVTGVLLVAGTTAPTARDAVTVEAVVDALGTALDHARSVRSRESALSALRHSEEQFRSTFHDSPIGMALVGLSGRFVHANPAFCKLLGYGEDRLQATDVLAITHPEDVPRCAELAREQLAGRISHMAMEKRYVHRDGHEVWVQLHTSLVRSPDGRPLHYIHQAQDITEMRRARHALERQERELRRLVDQMPVPVAVGRGRRFLYVNPAWAAALGYDTSAELVGRDLLDFLPIQAHAEMERRLAQEGLDSSQASTSEVPFLSRTGTALTWELSAPCAVSFEGEPALLLVGRDTTEQRRLQARLHLADRMATVGTLAAGVAHELNNPLTFVAGNLSWLEEELAELAPMVGEAHVAELRESVAEAQTGAERVRLIIRDLQAFSREEEGMGPVELAPVLERAASMATHHIRHRARLVSDFAPVPAVQGNAGRLGQVLLNLLVNAAQAIPEGKSDAHTIRMGLRTAPGGRVELSVTDTGVGMDAHVLPRIFEPFFTTRAPGQGTGLGLSVCHGIVQAHGGDIRVESTPGKGTTVTVSLPAAPGNEAPSTTAQSTPAALPRVLRVLVVDDEPSLGTVIRRMLGPGHAVDVHTRATEALEQVAAGARYDAVLCDLAMPDVDGEEFSRRLAQLAPELAGCVAFMTGGAFTAEADAFLSRLTTAPLHKPFAPDALRQAVRAAAAGN